MPEINRPQLTANASLKASMSRQKASSKASFDIFLLLGWINLKMLEEMASSFDSVLVVGIGGISSGLGFSVVVCLF